MSSPETAAFTSTPTTCSTQQSQQITSAAGSTNIEIDPNLGKALMHLSLFTFFVPVLLWLHFKDKNSEYRQHILEVFNFQIFSISSHLIFFTTSLIMNFSTDALGFLWTGLTVITSLVSMAFSLFCLIQIFWNAKQAYEGKKASYLNPLRLLK